MIISASVARCLSIDTDRCLVALAAAVVSATALKEGAHPDESEFNSLQQAAVSFTASFTGLSPAVQDNLSPAAREPIFADMASIVNGDVDAADAVAAVLEAIED